MSDHYNKQNFFLDEDDLRDYEEYKKSHGAAERSREKLPYIKDGEEDPVRVSSRKKAAGSGRGGKLTGSG